MTSSDDLLSFVDEDSTPEAVDETVWWVLVVDDDPDVHQATALALKGLQIEDRPLQLLHAKSVIEAETQLREHTDIAVVLLDVVMESMDAGLKLVERIRCDFCNPFVRIILRTGQPGYAPELSTIRDYDINDYKTKSELTRTRLFTSLATAIRAYRQLRDQEGIRRGLETVIRASAELTKLHGMQRFSEGLVQQLSVLLGVANPEGLICVAGDDENPETPARIIAAAGHYAHLVNQPLHSLPSSISQILENCLQQRRLMDAGSGVAVYFPTDYQRGLAAYLELQQPLKDTDQHLLRVFCSSMSVAFDNLILYQKMCDQAYTDPLLKIPNLNRLLEWLSDPGVVCTGSVLAILDLDDFSSINDILGHEFGDELLRRVYQRLEETMTGCRIARIGGDIFAIVGSERLLTPVSLRTLFSGPFDTNGQQTRLSATSGLLKLHGRSPSGSELLKDAHLVLKQTKATQRSSATYFSSQQGRSAREQMRLLTSLREAFDQTQFFLMYQPKIDLCSGNTSGFEALLRWRNAQGELIPPDRFIPLAEKSGLMIAIGLFVLRSACHCLKTLQTRGFEYLKMAVNVSLVQLQEEDFIDQLKHILEETDVIPGSLELEITESMAAEDISFIVKLIQQIRDLGVGIAIDDFGTGFSSLSILKQLPATRLKIDRAFINELDSDDTIARMVISLGHSLNLQVTAEGVETLGQEGILRELGCDECQGWLYAPALPEDELEKWLEGNMSIVR